MTDNKRCCICDQVANRLVDDDITRALDHFGCRRRVVAENELFVVIPSLGPLVPGHVLLCPKSHTKGLASLSSEFDAEFLRAKCELVETLRSVYRAPVHCFEHGGALNASRVICTVDHAHLHLLPADVSVTHLIRAAYDWTSVAPGLADLRQLVGKSEYVLYESPDGANLVSWGLEGKFESQFMRKVFAQALGRPDIWNWRESPNPRRTAETVGQMKSAMGGNGHVFCTLAP